MSEAGHLTNRFFGSLVPVGPRPADASWAEKQLLPGEVELWNRMSRVDRRHAVGVARRVEQALRAEATRAVLAAALLHDVGKLTSGLATFGRVVATLAVKAAGASHASAWSEERGFIRRVGLYAEHPRLGAELLELAGSDPLTVAWAREHHSDPATWAIPRPIGDALKAADND